MKIANHILFCTFLVAVATVPAAATPLGEKSIMLDWRQASQAEKDAWVAAFKFEQPDINRTEVLGCLEKRMLEPVFENNSLSGVTQMCGAIVALPD